jgi:peptidoglycan/LPS O-acetylase OafA/YrhL
MPSSWKRVCAKEKPMIEKNNRERLVEFEILRAIAIILLMVSHSDIYSQVVYGIELEPVGPYVRGLFLGGFFFMSGYLIEYSNKKRPQSTVAYFWSKFIRLFPPYWLALLSFVFILGYTLKNDDLIVYSLNLQFLFSPLYVKQLLTLWYLSVLFAYFIIYGLLLSRSTRTLLFSLAVIFIGSYIVHIKFGLFDYRFFEYYLTFLTGFLLARYEWAYEKVVNFSMPVQFLLMLAGFVLFSFTGFGQYEVNSWQFILVSDFHMLSMIIFALHVFQSPRLNWPVWRFIAYGSFFAYLFHRPIWDLMFAAIKFPWPIFTGWYRLIPGSIFVFVICYYMQLGYDRLLKTGTSLWQRFTLRRTASNPS